VKVLVVGSGAREHALCDTLWRDADVEHVWRAPGNAGTAQVVPNLAVDPLSGDAVARLAQDLTADLVVVGPEAPLVAGVADAVRECGIACFGPSAAAARLEGSKAFAKDVMGSAGVPTARAQVCTTAQEVSDALDAFGAPYVVKDDALAAGKGVVVSESRDEAMAHAAACDRVVVEEFLDGPEVSLFVITDGVTAVPLLPAQDFKRAGDGDTGPNTGGMGAYAPLAWLPDGLVEDVMADVVEPTLREMAARGAAFAGLLYVGLALTDDGPRVVEFNARFGDPETEVVLALLETGLGGLLLRAATGRLDEQQPLRWRDGGACTVVVAAAGYPGTVRTGDVVEGLDDAAQVEGVTVLHAGTREEGGHVVSAGGRVLAVTAVGDDLARARQRAYRAVDLVHLPGSHHREDIAAWAVELAAPHGLTDPS
jgi:phosphoribosylamine---glycine ligase